MERHLESVFEMFLQFNKESFRIDAYICLMQKINEFIDLKRNDKHLYDSKRIWTFQ
jgi:hypothetical protein